MTDPITTTETLYRRLVEITAELTAELKAAQGEVASLRQAMELDTSTEPVNNGPESLQVDPTDEQVRSHDAD